MAGERRTQPNSTLPARTKPLRVSQSLRGTDWRGDLVGEDRVALPSVPRTKIAARSKKRAQQETSYRKLRLAFLDGAVCAVCRRTDRLTVHHKRGRIGELLCAVEHWLALCVPCHQWVTEHPVEAIERGLSESRFAT